MATKERVKELEKRVRQMSDPELVRMANIFGRSLLACGSGKTESNCEPVTQEEFDWMLSRLKRLRKET